MLDAEEDGCRWEARRPRCMGRPGRTVAERRERREVVLCVDSDRSREAAESIFSSSKGLLRCFPRSRRVERWRGKGEVVIRGRMA